MKPIRIVRKAGYPGHIALQRSPWNAEIWEDFCRQVDEVRTENHLPSLPLALWHLANLALEAGLGLKKKD
jgi:hypothetical protein